MLRTLLALTCVVAPLAAQSPAALKVVDALNKICKKGVSNQPILSLAADGTVTRRDTTGNVFSFNAKQLGGISFDSNGECNVLVRCKDGGKCFTAKLADGTSKPSDLLVFSTPSQSQGDEIARLLKELKAACSETRKAL